MLLNIGSIHRVDDVPDTNVAIDGLSSLGSAGYADGDTGRSKRISELTNARTLTGPEQIPIVQAGVTHKTTLLNLLANTGAFDLTVPTGNEPLLTIEDGVTVHITLGQLFTLFMQWNDYIATNPLSAASGSGNNGLEIKLQAGDGDGSGTGGNISLQPGLGGDATPGSVEIPSPDGTYAGQLTVETDPYSMAKSLLITTSDIPAFGVQLYVHSGRPDQQNVNIPGSAWFESGNVVADGVDGADAGLGSGVTTTGQSGVGWLYSGNTNGGNSGVVQIVSGNVQSGSGNSGDINIASGSVVDGTRGNIVLDAPNVQTANQTGATASSALSLATGTTVDGASGGVFVFSGDTSGNGTTGNAWLYSGNTNAGTANTGDTNILTGDSFGGASGNIHLTTGAAAATRGNIILDTPLIASPIGSILHLTSLGTTGGPARSGDAGIESGDTTAGTGDSGNAFLGSSDAGGRAGSVFVYGGISHGADQQGGSLVISSGAAVTGNANGGDILIQTAAGVGTGRQGNITLDTGGYNSSGWISINASINTVLGQPLELGTLPNSTNDSDAADLYTGSASGVHSSGEASIGSGNATGTGNTGDAALYTGDAAAGSTGIAGVSSGVAGNGNSGAVVLVTGNATGGNSGNVSLITGTSSGGLRGKIFLDTDIISLPNTVQTTIHGTGITYLQGDQDTWLFSSDATGSNDSYTVGVGSGQADAGTSSYALLYTGNVNTGVSSGPVQLESGDIASGTGRSGNIELLTGQSPGGTSGDITLTTNANATTRGSIILNAPLVHHPAGFIIQSVDNFNAGTDDRTGSTGSSTSALYSGNTQNADSGWAQLYSGDVAGTGNSGVVWLNTGAASDGNSGNILLQTGAASGTRGSIVLDAPKVTAPVGQTLYLSSETPTDTTASGSVGMESADTQASGGDSGGAFFGSSDAGARAGNVSLYAGASHGADTDGGSVNITSGDAHTGNADGGYIYLATGNGVGTGQRGNIILDAARITTPTGSGAASGTLTMYTGPATGGGTGDIDIGSHDATSTFASGFAALGSGNTDSATTGSAALYTGDSSRASSGVINIITGNANGGDSGFIKLTTGPVYIASAVHFDNSTPGSVFLLCNSLACTNNSYASFSGWVNLATNPGGNNVFVSEPVGEYLNYFQLSSTFHSTAFLGAVDVSIGHAGGGSNFEIGTEYTAVAFNQWVHILWSLDSSTGTSALYINDVLTSTTNENLVGLPFTSDMNGKPFYVGDDTFGTSFIGDMADIWIAPGVSLLDGGLIPEATRRQFISASGKPVNPSGFPSSAMLFSGDSTTFATNQGSGGSFTLTGSLTDADTTPSQPTRGNIVLDAPAVQQGFATFGPDPVNQGVYGITANGLNIMATDAGNAGVGAWLFSADTTDKDSINCGLGTGNSRNGHGSGPAWLYTGNITDGSGNSGIVYIESGDIHDGRSGDIQIVTGHVNEAGAGTRGNITLDANQINGAPNAFFELCSLGTGGVDLFTNGVTGSDTSGGVGVGTGATETGTSGDVQIYTGNSSGGNSGNVLIQTGGADGTRGSIVFDAPAIHAPSGFSVTAQNGENLYLASDLNPSGNSGSAGIESGGAPSGTSGGAFLGTSDANKAGDVAIYGGTSSGASQQGGSINIYSGAAAGTTAPAGDIVFHPSNGTSRSGLIIFNDLPTASPGVSGAVWRDTGTSPHTLRIDP